MTGSHRPTPRRRAARVAAGCLAVAAGLLTTGCAPAHLDLTVFTLPAPTGPAEVGTLALHVPADPRRSTGETMAQLWYPAAPGQTGATAAWTSGAVAAADAVPLAALLGLDRTSIPDLSTVATHAHPDAPASGTHVPVVLFSPGVGLNRTASTALAEELAGDGVAMLAVDAPGDSTTLFPDGRLVTGTLAGTLDSAARNPDRLRQVSAQAAADRADDLLTALDLLTTMVAGGHDADGVGLPPGLAGALDLGHVVSAGHSLGGAGALDAATEDRRVVGAVDLDGTPWGDVVEHGTGVPTLVVTSADTDPAHDQQLAALLSAGGQVTHVSIPTARHYAFTDLMWWAPQLGTHGTDVLGTVAPGDLHQALAALLTAFVHERTGAAPGAVTDAIAAHQVLAARFIPTNEGDAPQTIPPGDPTPGRAGQAGHDAAPVHAASSRTRLPRSASVELTRRQERS